MGMSKISCVAGMAVALVACGSEKKEAAPAAAEEASLAPGLYELSAEVTQLASTDNTTPATKLKKGDKQVVKACVAADGEPAPELLAEEGDKCEIKNSYIRYGRMSVQMSCTREGMSGHVMPAMMGKFTADSFDGEITTMTYFIKEGDYRLTRKISAKRVGDCPAEGAPEAKS